MFGFVGLMPRQDGLAFNPHLPSAWRAVTRRVHWRGRRVHARLEHASRRLTATLELGGPMMLLVGTHRYALELGRPLEVTWAELYTPSLPPAAVEST